MGAATLDHALRAHVASWPDREATVCGGVRVTWPDLDERVGRLAGWLQAEGVGSGDRVAWFAQNCHRYLEGLLACARLGAVFAPLNWRGQVEELAFVLDDLEPAVVLWQEEEIGPTVAAVRAAGAASRAVWLRHDAAIGGYEEALASAAPVASTDREPGAAVLLLYTAAFDGRPDGALLPEASLLVQALYGMLYQGVGPADVYLDAGPLFHVGTLKAMLATFVAGGTNVFVRRVDPAELCELIEAERCTGAFLQPPTIEAIVELNRDGRHDLRSLRAKPGSEAWNAMVTVDPASVRWASGYGQTEVGGVVTFVDRSNPALGTAGRPGPLAVVEVVDADGRPVPCGETGELVVAGPMAPAGYHRRDALSASRSRGGWHHTGDLGRREPDGSLSFVGPLRRLIKTAAENVYPAEVEACLRRHAGVVDVAVIGRPDPTWGQRVTAVVVPAAASPSADDLIEHCRSLIASYKKPRDVVFVEALPRAGAGVDYDALDAAHGGGGYPGSG